MAVFLRMRQWLCTLLLVGAVWLLQPSGETAAGEQTNGITAPANGSTVQGRVEVRGIAAHPSFRKWQLDLLLGDHATFLALEEQPLPQEGLLTTLDTTRYPNGSHRLRLRVVREQQNYDEYTVEIRIDNPGGVLDGASAPGTEPLPVPDKVLYLTFDDGPSPYTPQVLTLLQRYEAKATFFVIGQLAQAQPELLRRIEDEGHTLSNHTYYHRSLRGLTEEAFAQAVQETQAVLGEKASKCLRPPYGRTDENTASYAAKLGYTLVLWTVDPRDWRRPGAAVVAQRVVTNIAPGAIVVLHDGGGDRSQTVAAVEIILRQLTAQGYHFVALCQ